MRNFTIILAAMLSLASVAFGADAATQQAAANGAGGAGAAAGPTKVWVPVFSETGNAQSPSWVAKTIRQSLLDELTGLRSIDVTAAQSTPADQAAAVVEAKNAGADVAVVATCQVVDNELRITGRVVDANSGRVMGAFKATGSQRDLFALEDSLIAQVRKIVAPQERPMQSEAVAETDVAARPGMGNAPRARYEGSDLQSAVRSERNFTDVAIARSYEPEPYNPQPYGYQPMGYYGGYSPFGYSSSFGYGGYWGWNSPSIIVINNRRYSRWGGGGHWNGNGNGDGHWNNGGGHWNGGGNWNGGGGATMASANGQAIRHAASYAGNPPNNVPMTVQNPPSLVIGGGGSSGAAPGGGSIGHVSGGGGRR